MSPGRSNKPLFEILSERPPKPQPLAPTDPTKPASNPKPSDTTAEPESGPASASHAGPSTKDPAPSQTPSRTADRPASPSASAPKPETSVRIEQKQAASPRSAPAPQPEADAPEHHLGARPTVTIPLSSMYIAVAGVMVVLVLTWIAAHTVGQRAAERRILADMEEPQLQEPPTESAGLQQGSSALPESVLNPQTRPREAATTPAQQAPQTSTPSQTGRIIVAGGRTNTDPRLDGHNYLELATLPQDQAVDAVNFLNANGVSAIAVPESSTRFRLIATELAVPSSRWTAMAGERTGLQQQVEQIGDRWVRERQGGSNFSQTLWKKYTQ